MPGTMGRPTKLDQELRRDAAGQPVTVAQQIVNAIGAGNYTEQAAASAGVDKTTVYDWIRQGARISTDIAQGRRRLPRTGTRDRQLLDFSHAVAEAEAQWEVASNATLERLSRARPVEETRTTVEVDAAGVTVNTKTVTVRKTEEADSATIRWRLERRFPTRYGRQQMEISGPGGGPIPLSIRDQAAEALAAAATRLAENAAATLEAQAPSGEGPEE